MTNHLPLTKALVIYHANCDDGFGAAFAFHIGMETTYSKTQYHPAAYGELPPEELMDKETSVWILDFSYPPDLLVELAGIAGAVTVLDHHKTANEAWDQYYLENVKQIDDLPKNLHVCFDQKRSGAMIAYDWFLAESPRYREYEKLFEFIQDRDLWKFANPDTKNFTQYLRSCEQTFDMWERIAADLNTVSGYSQIMFTGQALLRQYEKQVAQIVAMGKRPIWIHGVEGLECNCPGMFASDVGNVLAEESGTFGHTWFSGPGKSTHSLRSVPDFDVSEWAKEFGGGGHKNAAGFKMHADQEETHPFCFAVRHQKPTPNE